MLRDMLADAAEERAQHCTTHHYACDCRELMHRRRLERLQSENTRLREIAEQHAGLPLAADQNGRFYSVSCSSHVYRVIGPSRDIAHTPTCSVVRARALLTELDRTERSASRLAHSGERADG